MGYHYRAKIIFMTNKLNLNPKFEVAYKGKIFEIVKWEGKPGVMFEAAVRAPGVRLVIECEKDGQKALLMTKEIRREAGGWDYRLPGGKVFDSLDELDIFRDQDLDISEKALEAAKREGREEAGVLSGTYTSIGVSRVGATVDWDLHYFLVTDVEVGDQELEEAEQGDIETVYLSAKEVFEKLVSREVKEGRSADVLWFWLSQNGFIQFSE